MQTWFGEPKFRVVRRFQFEPPESSQQSTLRWIKVAREQRLDLSMLLRNQMKDQGYFYRKCLSRLADRLDQGVLLVDALEQTPGVVHSQDALAIRFAHQTGVLDETLSRLTEPSRKVINKPLMHLRQTMRYVCFLGIAILLFVTLFASGPLNMLPQVVSDITGENYPHFDSGVDVTPMQNIFWWLQIVSCMVAAFAFVLTWTPWSRELQLGLLRWISFGKTAQADTAQCMDLMADASGKGRPLTSVLSTLGRYHGNPDFRKGLLFARNELEHGVEAEEALVAAGILRHQQGAVYQRIPKETSGWWMRQMANSYRNDLMDMQLRRVATIRTVMIVLMSCLVGLLGWVIYSALSGIIDGQY